MRNRQSKDYTHPHHAESLSIDPQTRTMTGWMEMPDPMGGKTRAKTEGTWPDGSTRIVKVFGPDGGPEPFMTFTYQMRK